MPRYNSLIENLFKTPIFCNNLGFGEQGAVLNKLDSAIAIFPNISQARNMQAQLNAFNKNCVVIDDFDKPFTLSKFQSEDNKFDLINALYNLCFNNTILLSTPNILFSILPNLNKFKSSILTIDKAKEYNLLDLEKQLIEIGYKKVESVTAKGEFCRRGDILDVFNTIDETPTRFDFFDTTIENIFSFETITFEKQKEVSKINIAPNKILNLTTAENEKIIKELSKFKTDNNLFFDLISALERNDEIPLEFIAPFYPLTTFAQLNLPIVFSSVLECMPKIDKLYEAINDKISATFKEEKIIKIFKNVKNYYDFDNFLSNFCKNLIFLDNFDLNSTDLKTKLNCKIESINFESVKFPNFLNNLSELKNELAKYPTKQIYLCLNDLSTINALAKIFDKLNIAYSQNKNGKGIILTDLKFPYNICFKDDEKFYIGSTNFAHKKEIKQQVKTQVKYLPKAGEYVVHNVHGIGKCEGVVSMTVQGVEKEFFKLTYLKGDTLYVPCESADTLSLYMADDNTVKLNKLGGKEFAMQKLKASKAIEDMSKELIELYAKRKASKGFKFSEDDYLYLEFENAFEFEETPDQLQAIADVKRDMISGKVMDRLICGDVGFGKTEVAMRAMFKAVLDGKQVAILAPTTILSMQHYETAKKRTQNFKVNVEMLNRFKSPKEQQQILTDLADGKINVICGTHRLLSSDVKFKDLGLLILDEEQRFGVKAKEQIKQMKNNVDVLTLSATPIPRTLSMSLMNIRDISIINTPPTNRLAIKTYVLEYNPEIIANAINDEINRGGQVLVVYNNIEKIFAFASKLEQAVNNPAAHFDVAHGQMTGLSLENAIKRLYEHQTNVFVSTTLIENGVDLPKANTLIVIESNNLGLSQMYQLRGRVGRSNEQAYAYFTYPSNKVLSEDASNRLQALAENTELGSGFKIAMRDLQIRGAGEILGKVQHGHMVKIGYDMYTRLLNETLKRLSGEKVDVEREIKIDIALTSKIPYNFVPEEAERLKIVAKIAGISDQASAKQVIADLTKTFGKLPNEIYNLVSIALIKALGVKQKVKNVTITSHKMFVTFYEDVDINLLMVRVNKFKHLKFEQSNLPTIVLNPANFSVLTAVNYLTEFLASN